MVLSHASVDKLIRKAGAERVSEDAAVALAAYLDEEALVVARAAVELAEHAGRKTVKSEDIRLALKKA